MTTDKQTHRTLQIIALLLFANVATELYETFIPEAHATSSIDCKIVDISSNIYTPLPIRLGLERPGGGSGGSSGSLSLSKTMPCPFSRA